VAGRWINRDPIREAGGLNLYAYVGANPIIKIDPYGLWEVFGFGGGGVQGPGPISPTGEGLYFGGYNSSSGAYTGSLLGGGAAASIGPVEGGIVEGKEQILSKDANGQWKSHCESIHIREIGGGPWIPFFGHVHIGIGRYETGSGDTGWFFYFNPNSLGGNGFFGIGIGSGSHQSILGT
jgi:hypothetical protein